MLVLEPEILSCLICLSDYYLASKSSPNATSSICFLPQHLTAPSATFSSCPASITEWVHCPHSQHALWPAPGSRDCSEPWTHPQEPSRSSQHGAQDLLNEYLLNHLLFSSSLFLSFNYLDNKSTKALQGGNPQILCVRPIAGTCVVFSWQWEQRLQGIHFIFHHEEEEIAHCGTKWVWVRILTLWFRICVMLRKSLNLFDSGLSSVKPRLWRTVGEI